MKFMDRELIKSKVISIIESEFSEGHPVSETSTPMDFEMDSLDMLELSMLIEEEFQIELPENPSPFDMRSDEPFSKLIDALVDYVNQ